MTYSEIAGCPVQSPPVRVLCHRPAAAPYTTSISLCTPKFPPARTQSVVVIISHTTELAISARRRRPPSRQYNK